MTSPVAIREMLTDNLIAMGEYCSIAAQGVALVAKNDKDTRGSLERRSREMRKEVKHLDNRVISRQICGSW
jgi:hypothetical protein